MTEAGKMLLSMLGLFAVASAILAIETWLDRKGFDRLSTALVVVIASGFAILFVVLFIHFGRFV